MDGGMTNGGNYETASAAQSLFSHGSSTANSEHLVRRAQRIEQSLERRHSEGKLAVEPRMLTEQLKTKALVAKARLVHNITSDPLQFQKSIDVENKKNCKISSAMRLRVCEWMDLVIEDLLEVVQNDDLSDSGTLSNTLGSGGLPLPPMERKTINSAYTVEQGKPESYGGVSVVATLVSTGSVDPCASPAVSSKGLNVLPDSRRSSLGRCHAVAGGSQPVSPTAPYVGGAFPREESRNSVLSNNAMQPFHPGEKGLLGNQTHNQSSGSLKRSSSQVAKNSAHATSFFGTANNAFPSEVHSVTLKVAEYEVKLTTFSCTSPDWEDPTTTDMEPGGAGGSPGSLSAQGADSLSNGNRGVGSSPGALRSLPGLERLQRASAVDVTPGNFGGKESEMDEVDQLIFGVIEK